MTVQMSRLNHVAKKGEVTGKRQYLLIPLAGRGIHKIEIRDRAVWAFVKGAPSQLRSDWTITDIIANRFNQHRTCTIHMRPPETILRFHVPGSQAIGDLWYLASQDV
jgi:hypothetical protein